MPSTARSHIQKIAPGPPTDKAVATPAMLPIPTVLARAVLVAWNGVIRPKVAPAGRAIILPRVWREGVAHDEADLADLEEARP